MNVAARAGVRGHGIASAPPTRNLRVLTRVSTLKAIEGPRVLKSTWDRRSGASRGQYGRFGGLQLS
jgi:uncharacterized glyoxalase superfamily metalloenzyme YdcJ